MQTFVVGCGTMGGAGCTIRSSPGYTMNRYRADKTRTITERNGVLPLSTTVGAVVFQRRNWWTSATTRIYRSRHGRSRCFIDPQLKLSSYGWSLSVNVAPAGEQPG